MQQPVAQTASSDRRRGRRYGSRVCAEDIDRAAAFYGLLGLKFRKRRHGSGPEHYAAELGNMVFEIYPRQNKGEHCTRIGFQIPSIDAVIADLESVGARVVSPPKDSPWGRRAVIDDLDGYRVELTEPQKGRAAS